MINIFFKIDVDEGIYIAKLWRLGLFSATIPTAPMTSPGLCSPWPLVAAAAAVLRRRALAEVPKFQSRRYLFGGGKVG